MSLFKSNPSKEEYELLEPFPKVQKKKPMLKYAVISGVLCAAAAVVLTVVILNSTESSSSSKASNELQNDSNSFLLTKSKGNVQVPRRIFVESEEDYVPQKRLTAAPSEDVLVELDQGVLRGLKLKSRGGREFLAFMGIPYAKPPLGDLRFKAPVEAEPWEGILNATVEPLECIQKDKYNRNAVTKGKEDCLYLNVYTPKSLKDLKRRRNRFPVMLYIHGGGPFGNASRYRPDYFMDEDVIFITVHYRLGVLGNLNLNDRNARGNQGMKDQVMALQWIQDNIRKFGGTKRKVTLFGNSFGSMEVHSHVLSPMSKRLFHRVICQSGVVIYPGVLNENPLNTSLTLADKVNCTTGNNSDILSCLRNISAEEIVLASYTDPFVISIETASDTEDSFLTDHPLTLLENGNINEVPAIFGVNSGEGISFTLPMLLNSNLTKYLNENFNEVMGIETSLVYTAQNSTEILNAVRSFYLGNQSVSRETQGNFTNIITDRQFIHPATVSATFQSQFNGRRNKVFLYYFNYVVPRKYSSTIEAIYKPDHFLGASHADELQLLFPYDDYPYIPLDSKYANLSQMMVKLWVSFAENGEPTGTANEWLPIKFDEKPYKFFELNDFPKMVDPVSNRLNFWDGFNLDDLYRVVNTSIPIPL